MGWTASIIPQLLNGRAEPSGDAPLSVPDRQIVKKACRKYVKAMSAIAELGNELQLTDAAGSKKRKSDDSEAKEAPAKKRTPTTGASKKRKAVPAEAEPVKKKAKKRTPNAYMQFVKRNRCEVVARDPDAPMIEVSKRLGAMWKRMNAEEKQVYIDIAQYEKAQAELSQRLDD